MRLKSVEAFNTWFYSGSHYRPHTAHPQKWGDRQRKFTVGAAHVAVRQTGSLVQRNILLFLPDIATAWWGQNNCCFLAVK